MVSLASVAACGAADSGQQRDDVAKSASALCRDVSGTNIRRSLVVTDKAILAKFPFLRTMDAVRTSANVASPETSLGVWKRWMHTFDASETGGTCDDARVDPNGYGLVCPRTPEALLVKANPFENTGDQFRPVGLFNRFDLAPATGEHCGEYRIVYAKDRNGGVGGRAFIIFEGILPNPTPSAGVAACLPVAQFWQALTTDDSATSRAAKLEKFYYAGGVVPGFGPVVRAANYGLAANDENHGKGQVRTNFFIQNREWQLREFKTRRSCANASDPQTCTLAIQHVAVKVNPAEELFAGTHANSAAFQTAFLDQVPGLAGASDVNAISMGEKNTFNEFESVSGDTKVVYKQSATAAFKTQIQQKLTEVGSPLTPNNVLNRATTQTCGGCHQQSQTPTLSLGGGLVWPSSLGFVQIDESSALSQALTDSFLPHRKRVLEQFINDRCNGAPLPAGDRTIGGSSSDAPN